MTFKSKTHAYLPFAVTTVAFIVLFHILLISIYKGVALPENQLLFGLCSLLFTGYALLISVLFWKKHKSSLGTSVFSKKIVDNSPVGIAVFDQNHQKVLSNNMMNEIFEMDFKYLSPDNAGYIESWKKPGIENFIIEIFRGENKTSTLNTKRINENDKIQWISITGLPYMEDEKKYVLLLFTDITPQVQYENELKELNMQMSTQNMISLAQNEEIRRINKLLQEKEAGIRRKSDELELLTHNINVQIWYLQGPGLYGAVNKAHADFLNKPLADVMHREVTTVVPESEIELYTKLYQQVFSEKKGIHVKKWLQKWNGEKRFIEMNLNPHINKKTGNIDFVVCSGIDVTNQWKAEKKLTRNLEQQRHLSSISYAFNSLHDTGYIIQKALEEIGERTGLSRIGIYEKMEYSNSFDYTFEWCLDEKRSLKNQHVAVPSGIHAQVFSILQQNNELFIDNEGAVPDKLKFFFNERKIKSLLVLPIFKMHRMTGFICFEESRNERVWEQSERELLKIVSNLISNSFSKKKMLDELTTSEKKFRSLYEHMDEAFFILKDERITDCNIATVQLFNFEGKNALVNQPVTFISPEFQPDNVPSAKRAAHYYKIATGQGSCRFEWVFTKRNGATFHAEVTLTSINMAGERVFFAICHDIEELKKYQQELKKAKISAEKANNLKSLFLANVSHEIRTPMNAILGYARILSNRGLEGPLHEYVRIIHNSGQNLLALLNDILDLSKIEAGKLEIENKPLLLPSMLDEIKNIFRLKASQKSIDFETVIDPQLPQSLVLDQTRLRQILFNLVGNAVKFTEDGFVKLSVVCTGIKPLKNLVSLRIIVEDSGIGIREDQLGEIFNTFQQQAGQNSKYGGTGLGLAITRKLVEMMGGKIFVSSEVRVGSRFVVEFTGVKVNHLITEIEENIPATDNIFFNNEKVLVAEDNPVNADLLKTMLEDRGLIVELARHGKDAISRLKTLRPKAIMMDMKMPVMGGFEAIKMIKSTNEIKDIPVIAMSAQAMKEDKERIMKSGCEDFISKPINEDELLHKLTRFINSSPQFNAKSNKDTLTNNEKLIRNLDRIALGQDIVNALYNRWKSNNDSMQLEGWKTFGETLKKIGIDHGISSFIHLGDEFLESVEHYDINKLKSAINTYPKLPGAIP